MEYYLSFDELIIIGKKTKTVLVRSKSSGDTLGTIKWYCAWRQYCFYPNADTLWSKGCLDDVNNKIRQLMEERKIK